MLTDVAVLPLGGNGADNAGNGAGSGGGGGGGYRGGGGGASGGASGGGGGGGAAGTSFWSAATSSVLVTNGIPGNGGVVVSWTPSPTGGVPQMDLAGCCASQTFTVPDNVTELTVTGWGGSGGLGGGTADGLIAPRGGFGAVVRALVARHPRRQAAHHRGRRRRQRRLPQRQRRHVPDLRWRRRAERRRAAGRTRRCRHGRGRDVLRRRYRRRRWRRHPDLRSDHSTVLLDAGGGGGGGGDSAAGFGVNGGLGGNAGSPVATGNPSDGAGYFGSGGSTPGYANGAGGLYAAASGPDGQSASDSTAGNVRGTGGGGGGGVTGGGAGLQCSGAFCAGSGGGGAAGSSSWASGAQAVTISNSLGGGGGASISWVARAATQTAISASANPVQPGAPVTLTATVTTASVPAEYTPTGSITFIDYDTGLPIGLPVALSADSPYTASATTTLPGGTNHVYAFYSGDSNFLPSTSTQLAEVVRSPLFVKTTSLPSAQAGIPYSTTLDRRRRERSIPVVDRLREPCRPG